MNDELMLTCEHVHCNFIYSFILIHYHNSFHESFDHITFLKFNLLAINCTSIQYIVVGLGSPVEKKLQHRHGINLFCENNSNNKTMSFESLKKMFECFTWMLTFTIDKYDRDHPFCACRILIICSN